jgi:hypothetical protein
MNSEAMAARAAAVPEATMKHGVHLAATLAMTAALGSAGASAAPAPATDLELRRVLLSSGGVGYFEYEATLPGEGDLHLSVRRDQVDDVLKSLVIADDVGNQGEVSLPGKEPVSEGFRDLPLPESALDSPAALLDALRGAEVRVESPGAVITGRIVSVTEEQVKQTNGEIVIQHRLSLLSNGVLRQVVVEQIESLKVLDEALQKQLDAALDALSRQRERDRRELVIHLHGARERVVRVGYVVEVPLWKSTYRLVLPPPTGAENAALTGFAVVENRTGEPWSNVDLTLVAGNPVTFRQAIYDTYYVNRPTVPVEVLGRVLPQPDEGGVPVPAETGAVDGARAGESAPAVAIHGGFQLGAPKRRVSPPRVAPITPAEATEEATQVVFHLPAPVSLGAGQTALLPVLSLSLPAPRASLYQPETEARHPLSSIEITNTGTTDLPPGVLAIYERAAESGELTYAGDAQLSLLPTGKRRFVSYAVDLRVTVDRAEKDDQTITLAKITGGTLILTRTERKKTIYTIAGAARERRTLIVEHPRIPGFELVASDDYQVIEVTQKSYRLKREIPADATVKLAVVLERPLQETINLASVSNDQLGVYAASADLPAKVREGLRRIIDRRADVAAKETALSQRTAERAKILEDQTRLRENLKVVPAGSDLAKRYLARLDAQEDRLSALEGEIAAAEGALRAARAALAAEIRALSA